MKAAAGSLHGIIDTVSAKHDLGAYLALLKTNGAPASLPSTCRPSTCLLATGHGARRQSRAASRPTLALSRAPSPIPPSSHRQVCRGGRARGAL